MTSSAAVNCVYILEKVCLCVCPQARVCLCVCLLIHHNGSLTKMDNNISLEFHSRFNDGLSAGNGLPPTYQLHIIQPDGLFRQAGATVWPLIGQIW